MRKFTFKKTAIIGGRRVRLNWQPLDTLDGWYAEVNPRALRALERDSAIDMGKVEDELQEYGDYVRRDYKRLAVYKMV